jgi:metal-sulfur cluster biosynthetic enzyme
MITAEEYREALKAVIDPEIFQNIVDLGLVYGVSVGTDETGSDVKHAAEQSLGQSAEHDAQSNGTGDDVVVTMTLTSPQCPLGPEIMRDVEQTLRNKGAAKVTIDLVWQPMWTPDAMTEELKRELGILEQEEEPTLEIELPPPPPIKKKGWLGRLFGR